MKVLKTVKLIGNSLRVCCLLEQNINRLNVFSHISSRLNVIGVAHLLEPYKAILNPL